MKLLWGFLLIALAGVAAILLIPSLRNNVSGLLSYSSCNTAQPYKIGSIDPRFGLSSADVFADTEQATSIWSNALGKMLFTYSPNAHLTVNFIYDERQALNSQIQQLDSSLNQKSASLEQKVNAFKLEQAAFEQKLVAFDVLVNKYNSQGGAPADVYSGLIDEQNALNAQAQSLNATAKQLNLSTSDYNSGVSNLNQDVHQLNTELSQKPEEGLYNGQNDTITIYLTNSKDELIHTLTHEFGHSLGMNHVAGETSIMFPYTSTSVIPTSNDIAELNYVCRKQSLIVHETVVFDMWFYTTVQNLKKVGK